MANLRGQPFVEKVSVGARQRIIFIGDIHGSAHSLLRNLLRLQAEGILDDNFKLIDNYYLLFTGDYADTDELWADIERQCRPDDREAHYERLAGRRMRLTEEAKETGREDRAEKRQREKEAQRKERFERLLQRATELRANQLGQTERGPTADQRSD